MPHRAPARPVRPVRPVRAVLAVCAVSALAGPAAPLAAQSAREGYAAGTSALPPAANAPAVVPGGLVWFDGQSLVLERPGAPLQTLLQLPAARFAAFTRVLDGERLLFAESSLGEVWLVPLRSGPPRLLATVTLPYDAAPLGPHRAVLSAKTGGFAAPDSDLLALDLQSGAVRRLGGLPGASGPVAVDAAGALLCATAPLAFPPPPGAVQVLRWTAAQWAAALAGGPPLAATGAATVAVGLDAASQIALDGDGDLLFVDWVNGRIGELDDIGGTAAGAQAKTLVDYAAAAVSPAWIQFAHGGGTAAFEPFAPAHGGVLFVQETDFAQVNVLRELRPRPALTAVPAGPVPAGPFAVGVQQGPAGGLGLIALGAVAAGVAVPVRVPGIEQTLWWDAALLSPVNTHLAVLDASGAATLPLVNPGFAGGLIVHVQLAVLDAAAATLGGDSVRSVQLAR